MAAIISLLIVVALSLLITRVATVALTLTGMSREAARFQARSAFSGVGFTTKESEQVVQHPVRRRIILLLILLGNAGVVTALASLIISFTDFKEGEWLPRLLALLGGLAGLWVIAASKLIDRGLSRVIGWALKRWTHLDVRDYAALLNLSGGYRVVELQVKPNDWLANRRLSELKLRDEGILVLGIHKADGTYIGAPRGHTEIHPGDLVVLYGRAGVLCELDARRRGVTGDKAHAAAVREQQKILREEAER
ncbi:TrkA C-terminal domain-containing protein [Candidatus Bipolaricaulota bacterium]|nr:TrkA C-terminal domain-containing protein [Candidatus Bipolaricaulota bacterium]